MTVTYETYMESKIAFIKKHHGEFYVQTSPMDEYDRYHKEYFFEDGAVWYEVMGPSYQVAITEVKMAKVKVEVKMFETEFWTSDDAKSRFCYEQY